MQQGSRGWMCLLGQVLKLLLALEGNALGRASPLFSSHF